MWLIIIPVVFYSILATSAGQSFSLGLIEEVRYEQQAEEIYRQEEITELLNNISDIDAEVNKLNIQIAGTIINLEDRYEWKNTLAAAESRTDELKNDRVILRDKLSVLRSQATTHDSVETATVNIYEFYHQIFGWEKKTFQFILHTILSAFIAAMAPIGIITLGKKEEETPEKKQHPELLKKYIKRWVWINWMGQRTGQSENILQENTFYRFLENNKEKFPRTKYDLIYKTAVLVGAIKEIKKDGMTTRKMGLPEAEVIKLITNKLCNKTRMSFKNK